MGNLSPEYYQKKLEERTKSATTQANSLSPISTTGTQAPTPTQRVTTTSNEFLNTKTPEKKLLEVAQDGEISSETQVDRFGGAVGSPEYAENRANRSIISRLPGEIATSLGINFPVQETWDKMSRGDQAQYFFGAAGIAAARLVAGLPKEIVRGVARVGATTAEPWISMAKGESGSLRDLKQKQETLNVPWLGEVPTYYQTYQAAKDSGLGTFGASLQTTGLVAGDVSVFGSVGEAVNAAFKPKPRNLAVGEQVKNIEPVKKALQNNQIVNKGESMSEYYSLPRSITKDKYFGSPSDTFLKITPVNESSVEVAVVQTRTGLKGTLKNTISKKDLYKGDFGNEFKIESNIVKLNKPAIEVQPPKGDPLRTIPSKPIKGFETNIIKDTEIQHLYQIGDVIGIDKGVRDTVIKTITGKSAVGDLTHADYVTASQGLAAFKNVQKYKPDLPTLNVLTREVSPARHYFRSVEEKTGVPVYSKIYTRMEDAKQLQKSMQDAYLAENKEIFGKYADPKFVEEQRLVFQYNSGNKGAIIDNKTLSPEIKNELIDIANKNREMYNRIGPTLGVPEEIFLKDYQPWIEDMNGVYQMYKTANEVPGTKLFFAKQKRKGNFNVSIDNAMVAMDKYARGGSVSLFYKPVLEEISALMKTIDDPILKKSVDEYMKESLGYMGNLEQGLDNMSKNINKKLGTNLPEDISRRATQTLMNTTYSGAMGANPATAIRNSFQYELLSYPRLGPRFYGKAKVTALTDEGIKEVADKGFLVKLGVPYGSDLADSAITSKIGRAYTKITQGSLWGVSKTDQFNRATAYWQTKYQFDDTISKFNSGKISWDQVEKELDFGTLSPIDQNIIREKIIAKDLEGARDHLIRDVIDDTQFPFRKGASAKITYGLKGKIGFQFMQWPIEFAHTQARWLSNGSKTFIKSGGKDFGDLNKIIRFYSSSAIINESLKESVGVDFSGDTFYNPLKPRFSPFVQGTIETVQGLNAWMGKNAEELEKHKDALSRSLLLLAPAGVEAKRLASFKKSFFPNKNSKVPEGGPIGPDGKYPVYSSSGAVLEYVTFKDLWMKVFGFKTKADAESRELTNDILNRNFDRTKAKQEAMKLFQKGEDDDAIELIQEYGLSVTPADFEKYSIPYNQRLWNNMSAIDKGNFAPRVFPDQFNQK